MGAVAIPEALGRIKVVMTRNQKAKEHQLEQKGKTVFQTLNRLAYFNYRFTR